MALEAAHTHSPTVGPPPLRGSAAVYRCLLAISTARDLIPRFMLQGLCKRRFREMLAEPGHRGLVAALKQLTLQEQIARSAAKF